MRHLLARDGSRRHVLELLERVQRAGQELQPPGERSRDGTLACTDHQLFEARARTCRAVSRRWPVQPGRWDSARLRSLQLCH